MKLDIYLIIGLTKESRHWSEDFVAELQSKLNPHSIQTIDLPGSGKFLNRKSPMEMKQIVEEARAQVVFHPGHQRLLIAVSMGGMSAWSWTTEFSDDFTHLVLINSSLGSLSPFWRRAQPKAIFQFFNIAATPKGIHKEKKVLALTSNHSENALKILPRWTRIGEEANMSLLNTIRQLISAMRFKPQRVPKIPLLVVAAKHDRLAHFSCSEAIARHAKAKLYLTEEPSIGHAFHVDAPVLLANTISNWIRES